MSAIRVARGYTGRDKIVKCDGYHAGADLLLVAAGSGVATLGIPGCPGIPAGTAENTLVVPFNDAAALKKVFETHGERIAAVILEPVAGNMGVVMPMKGYLAEVRRYHARCRCSPDFRRGDVRLQGWLSWGRPVGRSRP